MAFFDEDYPYIVPLNFGVVLENNEFILYFREANAGKKIELSKKNGHVSFEMYSATKLITREKACNCTMEYESVCGKGVLNVVEQEKKIAALQALMKQYDFQKELI